MTAALAEDLKDMISSCEKNAGLLQQHPLYLLSFILEYRFLRWTDRYADLWRTLVEIETATNMTCPPWHLPVVDTERQEYPAKSDQLLSQLHAIRLEFGHDNIVILFAIKFAAFCTKALADVEDGRVLLECEPLSSRDRSAIDQCFAAMQNRCESMKNRLTELGERLNGQINVTFNLIAQRDSKINFAIAKLQTHDSRTIKAIAILTLLFLPGTFLATLWSTNLITVNGDDNWEMFLAVVAALTFVVMVCWWVYGCMSRRYAEVKWLDEVGIDSLPLLPAVQNV
ncbi:hypothetical protein S40288_04207 [Stachybotrys chartarum IBT 40288]|nr:hypothetical protein S40288_04207 [Stachybotrys chartarum IBT 40288]